MTGVGCGGAEGYRDEAFRRVIAEGERALGGPLTPALRPEVERLVAEAYGDIVYLAWAVGMRGTTFSRQNTEARRPRPAARRSSTMRQRFV